MHWNTPMCHLTYHFDNAWGALQMIHVDTFCMQQARDYTSKSSFPKTNMVWPGPPCFILTVSWGVVFWLRLPFVLGFTMKMPIRVEKQHCEKHSPPLPHTHSPTANTDTETSYLFEHFPLRCVFGLDSFWRTAGNFPARSSKVNSFQKNKTKTGMSSVLRLGFPLVHPNYKCIRIFSWDRMGAVLRIKELFHN